MKNIIVRPFSIEDCEQRLNLHIENQAHFQEWSPYKRSEEFFTLQGQVESINNLIAKRADDSRYDFAIYLDDNSSHTLIGEVQFTSVVRGPLQSSFLGYMIGKRFNGLGYMTKSLKIALKIAFEELNFHRVTAEVNPDNIASLRVLDKVGFVREGFARKNVKVGDEWRDHICLAMLEEDYFKLKNIQDSENKSIS
ncbi:GNAT family N-acetyltransferase [Fictibacillus nanhaiensis]|uniref:GNAT family N-acetyltransferase n=1 Tax=Fictibacillus nanhaiensis TaxID=742169 RepID=UPI001C97FE07|nr:GNAT family protein [Fictibacillus nanhaiensis]MBY6035991.1 GNAT family N-acetyltransferase [Fictibacillus nanhaiensis]